MAARGWEGDDDAAFGGRRGTAAGRDGASDAAQPRDDGDAQEVLQQDETAGGKKAPTTTKRKRNLLSESHLLSQEGFKKIYQTFPYQTSGNVVGQEAKALGSLIKMYKQWAYDLYPGLNFEDFVDRTETLGKAHGVQGLMSDLRSKEMRRALGLPEYDSRLPEEKGRRDAVNGDDEEETRGQEEASDLEQSGFIVRGGDDEDEDEDADGDYSEEEAML